MKRAKWSQSVIGVTADIGADHHLLMPFQDKIEILPLIEDERGA
jgi:hypothetical protein